MKQEDLILAVENSNPEKQNQKKRKRSKKIGFYYSFLTFALIFCLIQIGYGAILNVTKIISYQGKMVTLKNLLKSAQMRNQDLKSEKRVVTSDNSLEGIARNNLKMAGEDEVLIIINKKVETPKKKKSVWNFKGFKNKNKSQEIEPASQIYIPQEVVEE